LRFREPVCSGLLTLAVLAPAVSSAQGVFVSIPPQAFVVEALAGDLVQVDVLLPPGASPATYEPTAKQMATLDHAQLYLQIGDHGAGLLDPHIWLDPQRMKIIASTTADALEALLPDEAPGIKERLATLHRAIDDTDARVAALLAPFAGRTLLVFHPAYGYFTRRYGLIQMAVEVDGRAPSARRLATVVDELRQQPVPALFVQPQFSRSAAERVANALDCELVELDPLARDYLANLEIMADRIAGALR